MPTNSSFEQFSARHKLQGLTFHTIEEIQLGHYAVGKAPGFLNFQKRINQELLNHKVIKANPYTQWMASATPSDVQVKQLIVQFSVFSNQFLVAQLQKMLNAENLEEMRASKEILANEIGVVYNDEGIKKGSHSKQLTHEEKEFGGIEGSIEGGVFHFKAGHFELLYRLADYLSIDFSEIGRRSVGSRKTLFFCDELIRLYGNGNYAISTAASYAVENWAAAGFWDELVEGLNRYKVSRGMESLPLVFFTWHAKLEANHASHTQMELEDYYFHQDVNEDQFIEKGNEMLDGVYAFWEGLDQDRRRIH